MFKLRGRKTYIISIVGIIGAIASYIAGTLDGSTAANIILGFAGMSTMRSGINHSN